MVQVHFKCILHSTNTSPTFPSLCLPPDIWEKLTEMIRTCGEAVEEAGAARKRNISPPAKRRMKISIEDGIHVGLRMENPDRGLGGRVVK